MEDSEGKINFLQPGEKIAFCQGGDGNWAHAKRPVILFARKSGVVRRGICRACARIFVSLVPIGEEEE